MGGVHRIRGAAGFGLVIDRTLVRRNALAGDGSLVDAADTLQDEAVGREARIGFHDDHVADRQLLDRRLHQFAVLPNQSGARGELSQGLDSVPGSPHGVVLQRMAQAEQEQQQGAFGPGAQSGGSGGRHQHQGVDLEPFQPEVFDRLPKGEYAAEDIGAQIEGQRNPGGLGEQFFDGEPDNQQGAADKGEDELRSAAMGMGGLCSMFRLARPVGVIAALA